MRTSLQNRLHSPQQGSVQKQWTEAYPETTKSHDKYKLLNSREGKQNEKNHSHAA